MTQAGPHQAATDGPDGLDPHVPETPPSILLLAKRRVAMWWYIAMIEKSRPRSTVQYNINTKELRALPVAPIELQRKFVSRVEALESILHVGRGSVLYLDGLLSSLQFRAFSGQL